MSFESIRVKVTIEGTDVGKKIMPLYMEGKSITEIAKIFCIKNYHKLSVAINEYIQKNNLKIHSERIKAINPREIYELRKEGYTIIKIGLIYNINSYEVEYIFSKYCKENNISKKDFMDSKMQDGIDKEKLIDDFQNGYSINKLAEKYNISQTKVNHIIEQNLSPEERIDILNKNKNNNYIGDEKAFEILELYREGYTRKEIAEMLKIKETVVGEVLRIQYKKMGKDNVPKRMGKSIFLKGVKMKKYTREKIIEEADRLDIIIPKRYLDEYFGEEVTDNDNPGKLRIRDVDIKKIREFVLKKFAYYKVEQEDRKIMFKNFNIAKTLKDNGYNSIYQALALIYSLPPITYTTEEELFNLLENNEEMIQALKIIWDDTLNIEEYIEKLKNCKLAQYVKLAIILEEIREKNVNKEKLDMSKYEPYIKLAKETNLKDEYDVAIIENEQIDGEDR